MFIKGLSIALNYNLTIVFLQQNNPVTSSKSEHFCKRNSSQASLKCLVNKLAFFLKLHTKS